MPPSTSSFTSAALARLIIEASASFEEELRDAYIEALRQVSTNPEILKLLSDIQTGEIMGMSDSVQQTIENLSIPPADLLRVQRQAVASAGELTADGVEIGIRFDLTNQRVVQAARNIGSTMITNINKTVREQIREIIAGQVAGDLSFQEARRLIAERVGLLPRQNKALDRYTDMLTAQGQPKAEVRRLTKEYAERLLMDRASTISRTEVARATSVGQHEFWEQGIDSGNLPPNSQRQWIAGYDERVCDICAPMNGSVVNMDAPWMLPDGTPVFYPTDSHPNCRCTTGLVFPDAVGKADPVGFEWWQIIKGGPGSGSQPGHKFRGNQYTGGIPENAPAKPTAEQVAEAVGEWKLTVRDLIGATDDFADMSRVLAGSRGWLSAAVGEDIYVSGGIADVDFFDRPEIVAAEQKLTTLREIRKGLEDAVALSGIPKGAGILRTQDIDVGLSQSIHRNIAYLHDVEEQLVAKLEGSKLLAENVDLELINQPPPAGKMSGWADSVAANPDGGAGFIKAIKKLSGAGTPAVAASAGELITAHMRRGIDPAGAVRLSQDVSRLDFTKPEALQVESPIPYEEFDDPILNLLPPESLRGIDQVMKAIYLSPTEDSSWKGALWSPLVAPAFKHSVNGRIAERIYAASGDRTIVGFGLAAVYAQVDSQTREWATSAASNGSAQLQKSVSELIGNEGSFDEFALRQNQVGLSSSAFTDAYAQAVYAETQALLAASPELGFRAARGTRVDVISLTKGAVRSPSGERSGMGIPLKVAEKIASTYNMPVGEAMASSTWQVSTETIGRQPLSSWSTSTEVANQFAAVGSNLDSPMISPGVALVQRALIPESQVFATALTGPGCLAEQEVLVMEGTPGKTSVSMIAGFGSRAGQRTQGGQRLIDEALKSLVDDAAAIDADGDGWILEGTDQARFVGKADFVYDREVSVEIRSDGLAALLTWIPENWDAAYKTDVTKGGPGSGSQPGHKFRGNQWTGGIPENLDRGRVSSGIPRFEDSLLARPLSMEEAAARYGGTLGEVYQYIYDNYGVVMSDQLVGRAANDANFYAQEQQLRLASAYGNAQGLEVSLAALGPETRKMALEGIRVGSIEIVSKLKVDEVGALREGRWLGQYNQRTGKISQNILRQQAGSWQLGQAAWWESVRGTALSKDRKEFVRVSEERVKDAEEDLAMFLAEFKKKHGFDHDSVDTRELFNRVDPRDGLHTQIRFARKAVEREQKMLDKAKKEAKKFADPDLTVDDELYPPPFSTGSAYKQALGVEWVVQDRNSPFVGTDATPVGFAHAAAMATMVHEMGHRVHQVTAVRSELDRALAEDGGEFPFEGPSFDKEMESRGSDADQIRSVQLNRLERALEDIGYPGTAYTSPRVQLADKAWEKWQPKVTSWTRYGQYGDRKYAADSRVEDWAENFAGYILLGADNMDWFAVPRWAKPKPNMDPKFLDPSKKTITSFDEWLGEELIIIEKFLEDGTISTYPHDLSVESIWMALTVGAIKVTPEDQKRARKAYRKRKKLAASVDQDD